MQGSVGSSLGQKAEGNVHLGNRMSGGTTTGLLGKGGRNGQMGSKVILRQHQWDWDQGWLQFRAQEEAAKLWVRAGIQALVIQPSPGTGFR